VKRRRAASRRDCQAATEWYRDCAIMGEANAEFLYGFMHCAGIGVSKDDVRAHEWLRKASANESASAGGTIDGRRAGQSLLTSTLSVAPDWRIFPT
jgi:TPR repeat protein